MLLQQGRIVDGGVSLLGFFIGLLILVVHRCVSLVHRSDVRGKKLRRRLASWHHHGTNVAASWCIWHASFEMSVSELWFQVVGLKLRWMRLRNHACVSGASCWCSCLTASGKALQHILTPLDSFRQLAVDNTLRVVTDMDLVRDVLLLRLVWPPVCGLLNGRFFVLVFDLLAVKVWLLVQIVARCDHSFVAEDIFVRLVFIGKCCTDCGVKLLF